MVTPSVEALAYYQKVLQWFYFIFYFIVSTTFVGNCLQNMKILSATDLIKCPIPL